MLHRTPRICCILALSLPLFTACEDADEAFSYTNLFGKVTPEEQEMSPFTAVKSLEDVGLWPSDLDLYGDYAYVVDSGNNAITRISLSALTVEKNYADLGKDASPYAIHASNNALYVALQANGTIAQIPYSDPKAVTTVTEGLIAPTAVITHGENIIIADSEYDYATPQNTKGSIHFKTPQGETVLPSSSPNPAFLDIVTIEGKDYLLSINAGVIDFVNNTPPEKSCIDVWPLEDVSSLTKPVSYICIPAASLGRTAVIGDNLYAGDAMAPIYYIIPLSKLLSSPPKYSYSTADPELTKATITPVNVEDTLTMINFSQDTISWGDSYYFMTYSISGATENPVKGPIDIVYDAPRKHILILNSLSETVDVLSYEAL